MRLPIGPEEILANLAQQEPSLKDPGGEDYTAFWFVAADRFHRYGMDHQVDLRVMSRSRRVALAQHLAKATVPLGTHHHNWGPTSQLVREAFVAAYHEQAPLTSAEQTNCRAASPKS